MNDATAMLKLVAVTKHYGAVRGTDSLPVLAGINLTVHAGETLAIVGPSGSGKSTLLNIIGALDRPTGGQVLLEGDDLTQLSDEALAGRRATRIGFVFQDHHLLPQCSALENVLLPTLAHPDKRFRAAAERDARELLERVGLADHLHYRPGQMSTGQCQRVAAARGLINRPALVLADEPTGALDRASGDVMAQLLIDLNQQRGTTLIIVTHAAPLARRCRRAMELRDGQLQPLGG